MDPYAPPRATDPTPSLEDLHRVGRVAIFAANTYPLATLASRFTSRWVWVALVATLVSWAAVVTCAIAFLTWVHRSARLVLSLGRTLGVAPNWAVGWFFVPVANVVMPYRAVLAIVRGSSLHGDEVPKSLDPWWTAFVAWIASWMFGGLVRFLPWASSLRLFASPLAWIILSAIAGGSMASFINWTERNFALHAAANAAKKVKRKRKRKPA